jgi:hypothetical protein
VAYASVTEQTWKKHLRSGTEGFDWLYPRVLKVLDMTVDERDRTKLFSGQPDLDWPLPFRMQWKFAGEDRKKQRRISANGCTGWPTPTSRDHKDGASTLVNTPVNGLLGRTALLYGTVTGGSGALNPAHTLWLMGYSREFLSCLPSATASSPR